MKKYTKMLVLAAMAGVATFGCAADASVVQLPVAVVHSGGAVPRLLLAKVGDSNIKVVRGLDFKITSQPRAHGISKAYLESQVRKTVTSYDPQTGLLTVVTPEMAIGSVSAEVTVEVPSRVNLDIRSADGNVSLEGVSVETLQIETSDGNVSLVEVASSGPGRIRTADGNVGLQGASVGTISTKISGDGRLRDESDGKASGTGALSIVTKDGNVTIRK